LEHFSILQQGKFIVSHQIPLGYRMTGVHAGIKRNVSREDCSLIVSDFPAVAAGMYTQNLVFAAPVALDRGRTPGSGFRAVAINSGNANACTGERGLADAARMAELGAAVVGATGEQGLVLSTGIIGEFLPLEKIEAGIQLCAEKLGHDEESLVLAARGMMTTDTTHKLASHVIHSPLGDVRICGMAKGAAMIAPNMGTMLGLVLCDADLTPELAQETLRAAVEATFNCVSVDGHTSTNDTVLLLCNGASKIKIDAASKAAFQTALTGVCESLARQIPADGEGTTHVIEIHVTGCKDKAAARQIAKTVADSALVKCAVHGADPNWGRIVSAAGYAGVPFDPSKVDLHLNGFQLYKQGVPQPFDADLVSHSIRDERDTKIVLSFGEGSTELKYWTADLTAEYVRLNADYHT
jgi:glutamate N-acetyltransferase/amino-acid N-acetyltransferase